MKKVFSLRPTKLSSKTEKGKVNSNGSNVITLVKRTAEELNKSRCSAYTYLIP